jgi:fatty-acid desaturase
VTTALWILIYFVLSRIIGVAALVWANVVNMGHPMPTTELECRTSFTPRDIVVVALPLAGEMLAILVVGGFLGTGLAHLMRNRPPRPR